MSTGILRTFRPLVATQVAAVGTTAASMTLANRIGSQAVRIYNSGANVVFVDFNTTATTTASMPLAPGSVEVFTLQQDVSSISHIAGATGNTIYVTVGEGL